jgi:hypothetical protein
MWICQSNGFLSIVAPPPGSSAAMNDELIVRGRCKGNIEAVFPDARVTHTPRRDYAFFSIAREVVANAIAAQVREIAYGNFKGSVVDDDRHDIYFDIWRTMNRLQHGRGFKGAYPPIGRLSPRA